MRPRIARHGGAFVVCAALLGAAGAVHAQTTAPAAATSALTEGEVRKIDKEAGKLTLRHAPIDNLGMPAMTMVFKVTDPTMLDKLKEGDKVRFAADRAGGAITVTRIEVHP